MAGTQPLPRSKPQTGRSHRGAGRRAAAGQPHRREPGLTAERIFLVPDIHCGDSDPRAIALAAQLHEAFKPTWTIFLGDALDASAFSHFPVNLAKVPGQLAREVEEWQRVREMFPCRQRDFIPGNHDLRVLKWLWNHPQLADFKPLSLQSLIELPIAEKGYIELAQGNFIVKHGNYLSAYAGYSARKELERVGVSGASGHSHRLASYFWRDFSGVRTWTECGHLSANPPRYRTEPGPENWMQGVVTVHTEADRFHVEIHPFTLSYRCLFGGRTFSA